MNYNADCDVNAYAEEGTQKLYQGPGKKYGEVPGVRDIENGETLHITQDAEMVDGSHWGVTTVDGTEGWVDLEKTEEWKEEHLDTVEESVDAVAEVRVTPTEVAKETETRVTQQKLQKQLRHQHQLRPQKRPRHQHRQLQKKQMKLKIQKKTPKSLKQKTLTQRTSARCPGRM